MEIPVVAEEEVDRTTNEIFFHLIFVSREKSLVGI